MTDRLKMNRRQFVVTTAAVGGGMALGLDLPAGGGRAVAAAGDAEFSAWLVIGADDTITVRVPSNNAGQGGQTTGAMLVCEELKCDWPKVRTEGLTANRNVMEGGKYTAIYGSPKALGREREKILQVGASARERLKAAAAQQWNVPVAEIEAKESKLIHAKSGRTLRYGEVAAKAATIKLDAEPKIKPMDQWTFLGKTQLAKVESRGMVNGSAIFGIDVKIPGMLYAAIQQSPVFGGKLKSFDANAVKDRPGVVKVVAIGGPGTERKAATPGWPELQEAVVVVADHYWNAKTALDTIPIEWDDGPAGKLGTEDLRKQFMAKLSEPGAVAKNGGDVFAAMKTADKVIEAVYELPFMEHAKLEPINATALVTPDRVEVWGSAKNQSDALNAAARQAGIDRKNVFVNQENIFSGGDFGRSKDDETRLAVAIAMQVPGRPVKMIWSREEAFRHGHYRGMNVSKWQAGIGRDGFPVAWFLRYVGQSRSLQDDPVNFAKTGLDSTDVKILADTFDYGFPNLRVEYHGMKTHIRTGNYRGTGTSGNFMMIESFMDEIAHAGGKDPVELRRFLLRNAHDAGWLKVLNEVAAKAKWGKPLPKGRAQGIAMAVRDECQIAEVAEVSVSPGGEVKVHSIDMAFDVGTVMNPDGLMNQLQGGVMFALSDALSQEITVRNGRVIQGNFDDYPMLRIADAPDVRIHFGGLTGGAKLTPVAEAGNMPIAAAVCNAIFRATGKRIRSLPIRNHDLSWT